MFLGKIEVQIGQKNFFIKECGSMSTSKSAFVDLFWFINPKIDMIKNKPNKKINDNEIELLIASLNMSHGNIRFNAYKDIKNMIKPNGLFLDPSKCIKNCTLYPTSIFNILNKPYFKIEKCFDQIVTPYTNEGWQQEISSLYFKKENNVYEMCIIDEYKETPNKLLYTFENEQFMLFEHMLSFCLNQGVHLRGTCSINRLSNQE